MYAARNNHLETIQILLQHGAKVSQQDNKRRTAIAYAVQRGNIEIVEFLYQYLLMKKNKEEVQQFFDSKVEHREWTMLHIASHCGRLEVVKYLVQVVGVDVAVMDKNGDTAREIAESNGHEDIASFLLFIESNLLDE